MRGAAFVLAIAAVVVGATKLFTGSRRDANAHLRAELVLDVEQGGISDLGRAQALGRRLMLADSHDREAAAALAFTDAILAIDYGVATERETQEALTHVRARPGSPDDAREIAEAAHALLLLQAGNREAAAAILAPAAAAIPGLPHPLYALARTRGRGGDLPGAERALEAAIVGAPGFRAARVAWAETRLDLGDAKTAHAVLTAVIAQAPKDLRALLLLDEAEQALGIESTTTLEDACAEARGPAALIARGGTPPAVAAAWPPPAIAAACALARSARARRTGNRTAARAAAEAAARIVPDEPRLLSRTALALAQLGSVDRAAALLARARRRTAPETPTLSWAAAAVALGRGRAGALPAGPRPADPDLRLLVARSALAAGGLGSLGVALESSGGAALSGDADLRALARLGDDAAAAARAGVDDPVGAYVAGLRAQLDGDLPRAAAQFRGALSGHGDACRAAGEYVATLRALKLRADRTLFAVLRAENAGCVNLR